MEINEANLIEQELTLRNLRVTKEVVETRRSIVRWLALTLGVISPGESRLTAISVLDSVFYFQFGQRKDPTVEEMSGYINQSWGGEINEKTLRYHLLQLKKANIVDNAKGKYFLTSPQMGDRYDADAWITNYIDSLTSPIKEKTRAVIKELKGR
ncbi:MAG: hypothetical protein KGH66_00140 [Candidatus Micrarchaeota archaeon]|nr:hypothetical protein [Candidatus Micrarchaeota archaeon]